MTVLFKNNAASTLSSGITNADTSITVADGALFPSLTAGQTFYATLTQSDTETSWEVVLVTARAGDVLTVERGQDGTTAASWVSGSKIELRLTAAALDAMAQEADLKTVNGTSLLGPGNISVQATLVSATNIKTINGSSILGAGNLDIAGGGGAGDVDGGDATTTYTTPQVVDGGNANG